MDIDFPALQRYNEAKLLKTFGARGRLITDSGRCKASSEDLATLFFARA